VTGVGGRQSGRVVRTLPAPSILDAARRGQCVASAAVDERRAGQSGDCAVGTRYGSAALRARDSLIALGDGPTQKGLDSQGSGRSRARQPTGPRAATFEAVFRTTIHREGREGREGETRLGFLPAARGGHHALRVSGRAGRPGAAMARRQRRPAGIRRRRQSGDAEDGRERVRTWRKPPRALREDVPDDTGSRAAQEVT
jgi:hypothetical protein